LAAKETGGGGGATFATTGALMARAGGRGAGRAPAVGARACFTGATVGATVMVAVCICPTWFLGTATPACFTGRPLANAFCGMAVTALGAVIFANR
jgi:hypothetical protein